MKNNDLEKIKTFLDEHHILTLATSVNDVVSACSLFYAFSYETLSFVVASDENTLHIKNILKNNNIAGNILLETKTVGKIQGVQFNGKFTELKNEDLKKIYFKSFPYAKMLNPKLWQILITDMKMTDNRLGFGKKIIWKNHSIQ